MSKHTDLSQSAVAQRSAKARLDKAAAWARESHRKQKGVLPLMNRSQRADAAVKKFKLTPEDLALASKP